MTWRIRCDAGRRVARLHRIATTAGPRKWIDTMACPYLKEVVMLFCDAYCVKKMLPLDRIATANPCLGEFSSCPLFQELVARLTANAAAGTAEGIPPGQVSAMARKEGSR